MKLYLDLYFLMNALVDFLLLCVVGRVLHLRQKRLRTAGAAFLGAVFACIALMVGRQAVTLIVAASAPPLMLLTAFGHMGGNGRRFWQALFLFFGCSFLFGGICHLIFYRFAPVLNPLLFFAVCTVIFFFSFQFFDLFSLSETLLPVELSLESQGKCYSLRLLCDSGCLLREPVTGLPVILIAPRRYDAIFPGNMEQDPLLASALHMRLVPIKTASGTGVVPAVLPEKLSYITEHSTRKECRAMLGRAGEDSFAGFDGIFPASLL